MAAAKKNGKSTKKPRPRSEPSEPRLTAISLQGFKSFRDETIVEIRPLTLLAGANSSGKSSAVQPLLLLKQTLEATYDPGPLLLNGPNVRFSLVDQMLWRGGARRGQAHGFDIGFHLSGSDRVLTQRFAKLPNGGVRIERLDWRGPSWHYWLSEEMTDREMRDVLLHLGPYKRGTYLRVTRDRCALSFRLFMHDGTPPRLGVLGARPFDAVSPIIQHMIHVPGLRGNPERSYPTSEVSGRFPGVFQDYVASILSAWKNDAGDDIEKAGAALSMLGLTSMIEPRRLDDTRVELVVGRLPSSGKGDLVNIADVGFGVSQTLPVVVALLAAAPGQVVYLEQPEIHLHPRAQVALASLLLDAARRGVTVIAETHSDLLLRSVQRAVAAGEADPSLVALHWFARDKGGATRVSTAHLDAAGTYGDWPVDFADVDMRLESDFLDASLTRSEGGARRGEEGLAPRGCCHGDRRAHPF